MEERTHALGEIAWDVLHRILRELLARKPGGHLLEGRLDRLELRLPLDLSGSGAGPQAFAQDLVASLDAILDDAIQHAAAFRPGHAFCHRCGAATCEHSQPPSARHVFVGYAATGTPRWEDFAQRCLDLGYPDVDRLFEEPPAFITVASDGHGLGGQLLEAFRHERAFDLLGQVAAGFFPVRTLDGEGRGVLALSFQIAASRPRRGGLTLGLNVLGRTPQGQPLDLLWERQDEIPWRAPVLWAQAALRTLEGRRRREPALLEARVGGILRGLARRLERERRARSRRTDHAHQRHRSGERPTRQAFEDARTIRPDEVLVDERHGTLVVPGQRGRIHFFSPDGRLVSSVRYSREAIERKRKSGAWKAADPGAARAMIEALASRPE